MMRLGFSLLFLVTQASFALPPCPKSVLERWENCEGTYKFTNGDVYEGEFGANTMHGEGTYVWADGTRHIGQWANGVRFGPGTYTAPNGDEYVGEHANNQFHGEGVYTSVEGGRIVGTWQFDQPWNAFMYDANGQLIRLYANGVSQ